MLRLHEDAVGGWRALRAGRGVGSFCEQLERVPDMLNESIEPGRARVFCQWHNVWHVHVEVLEGTAAEHVMHEHEPAVIGRVRGGAALRLKHALYTSDVALDGLPSLCFDRHRWRAVELGTGMPLKWEEEPYQIRLHRVVIVVRKEVTRVQVLPAVRNRRVQSQSSPACVNACYTSAIHGHHEHPERLASIMRTEKLGACGHVHSVSTIFGVMELFRKRRGECMVIGKA